MDIKLKNKNNLNNNIKLNIIAVTAMVLITLVILSLYPFVKENGSEMKEGKYFTREIGNIINDADFYFLKDISDYNNKKNNSLEDVYVKSFQIDEDSERFENYTNSNENKQISQKKYINSLINNRYIEIGNDINYNYKNLQYIVLSKSFRVIKTNTNDNVMNNYDLIKKNYDFYVQLDFDENGYVNIKNAYGIDQYSLSSEIDNIQYMNYGSVQIENNGIKNTTIIYSIPKELKHDDKLSDMKLNFEKSLDRRTVVTFVLSAYFVFLICSFLIPYKCGVKILKSSFVKSMPFEIAVVLYGIVFTILCVFGEYIVERTLEGILLIRLNELNMGSIYSNVVLYILNIGIWIVAMYSIFTAVMLVKHILSLGIVNYLGNNTLVSKILRFLKNKIYQLKNSLEHIDLNDKSNVIVLKIVLINFLILVSISLIWFLGIVAAIIYSIIIYYLLMKYLNNTKTKFSKLMDYGEKISSGNLDSQINDDLGMFNPIKKVLMNINTGLKKAVSEEVKSQKMKTELISNVSHDLKTPLTSIITYIDLLKKDNISEEERKSYIDTLDKKSQRLKVLIEDLFEVSKATSGNIKLNLMHVDIVSLMRQTLVELEDKLNRNGLILKCHYPENKVVLNLDSSKTYRIFENLLNNVAKYAMEKSRVYIDVKDYDKQTEITIRNISADEMNFTSEEIMERFQRGDKSRNTEGYGLGLAIVKSFVEAQNGKFTINIDGDLFKANIIFYK